MATPAGSDGHGIQTTVGPATPISDAGAPLFLSCLLFAIGVFLTTLAAGDLTPLSNYPPFSWINPYTATPTINYNLAFVVFGPIIVIVGLDFVAAYVLARRRFEQPWRRAARPNSFGISPRSKTSCGTSPPPMKCATV